VFELDLHPMKLVKAPVIPQVGRLDGEVISDANVLGFLQQLGPIGHSFDRDGAVTFSEGEDFALTPFLNQTVEVTTTYVDLEVWAPHANDTELHSLRTGYLMIFLDGILLKQGQFSATVCELCYDIGVSVRYDGVRDLTNSVLAFLWNGSASIRISPQVEYDVHSESADYVEHLQVTESCVVERHLLDYMGVGNPSLRDCELQSWNPLLPVRP
jgi:hypothetical protein